MTKNDRILKRALEMAAFRVQKAGCEKCPKEFFCTYHDCPMTNRGCRDLLVAHFIRKAKEEMK